jgi:hypothetical protein
MDPEAQKRFFSLLEKTTVDIIADWKWPTWRRDDGQPQGDEQPQGGQ